jgi:hypothetical protein
MGSRTLVNIIRQPMLKLKAHSGFHDLFLNLLKHFQLIAFGARNNILQWFQYNYCLYRMLLTLR